MHQRAIWALKFSGSSTHKLAESRICPKNLIRFRSPSIFFHFTANPWQPKTDIRHCWKCEHLISWCFYKKIIEYTTTGMLRLCGNLATTPKPRWKMSGPQASPKYKKLSSKYCLTLPHRSYLIPRSDWSPGWTSTVRKAALMSTTEQKQASWAWKSSSGSIWNVQAIHMRFKYCCRAYCSW